jgi:histidinol-phosphatase (PHP family)
MNVLSNLHTHTTFCDGVNTPEEVVKSAIDKGLASIGFSGHGYTPYDLRYCMKDTEGYIAEITRLKEKYHGIIPIFLGSEEDAFAPVDRSRYDYIIGSSHYFHLGDKYLPIDSSFDYFKACLEAFNYDLPRMAETYFSTFCAYLQARKPDVIGHFDLITKFDELGEPYFTGKAEYRCTAEKYALEALKCGSLFEVNTGAISRGYRTTPYLGEDMLHVLKKNGAGLILSSDSHAADTIVFNFDETRRYLRDFGFEQAYTFTENGFVPYKL